MSAVLELLRYVFRLGVLWLCLLWLFPHLEWQHAWLISLGIFFVHVGADPA